MGKSCLKSRFCSKEQLIKDWFKQTTRQVEDPRQKPSGMTLNWITENGFTLIELLVVVLIIGILAAVAVPQYQKAVLKTQMATFLPIIKAVDSAQKVYYLANGEYATTLAQLDIEPASGETTSEVAVSYKNGHCWLYEGSSFSCSGDGWRLEKYYSRNYAHCWYYENEQAKSACKALGAVSCDETHPYCAIPF